MADSDPKTSPNAEPEAPSEANVFSYDVASQVKAAPEVKPNPNSPLAAGWYDRKRSVYSWVDRWSI